MDFTAWVESLKSMAQVLAGFGLVTVLLSWLKHAWEERLWTKYKERVEAWANRLLESEYKHPNELTELEWQIECERLLSDAGFGPLQIQQLMSVAVIVAKGLATDKVFREQFDGTRPWRFNTWLTPQDLANRNLPTSILKV